MLVLAGLLAGCGTSTVLTENPIGTVPPTDSASHVSTPVRDGDAVAMESLDVVAVNQDHPQVWTFVGPDEAMWEDSFTRESFPVGHVQRWFADPAGGVLVGRNPYAMEQSGLERLTADGEVTEVLPTDDELYAELVGVGVVEGRAAAVMAELDIDSGPDSVRIAAYDVVTGEPLAASRAEIGLSRDIEIVGATISGDVIAYATIPTTWERRDGEQAVRVAIEVAGTATELWAADDRVVTAITFGPGTDQDRLYVVTVPKAADEQGAAADAMMMVFDGADLVTEVAVPGPWGPVDEDWVHLPTRISTDGRLLMIAGEPALLGQGLVDMAEAPPSPVWLLDPRAQEWTRLDVTGTWSLRGVTTR